MKFSTQSAPLEKQHGHCLIIGIFENALTTTATKIDNLCHKQLSTLLRQEIFQGKIGQTLALFNMGPYSCLILVGCGIEKNLTMPLFKKIILSAGKTLLLHKISTAVCYLAELTIKQQSFAWKTKQLVETLTEASYHFDLFKTDKEASFALKNIIIDIPSKHLKASHKALKQGEAIATGVILTKNLANLPSNICTPSFLAKKAKELAKEYSALSVKILNEKEMKKLGMGALLGVAKGSAEEAQLICLEYKGTRKKQAPIAFVGKGITFDTGGNSLKTPENMVGMKYDMCGAATVLGVIKASVILKLPLHLIGIIPAVENMPGGSAYKPEDILKSLSGQTIEVISTDAEGRLILADALTYCERYQPAIVIDIATLTAAVVIALGFHTTGLLSNDQALATDLLKAGETSNDRAWQLPLWDEYQEQIKSPFADMANTGGRAAGSITAACFLSRFTKKFRWAHLDVAGTAAMMTGSSERFATGRPVPLLMQYLLEKARQ